MPRIARTESMIWRAENKKADPQIKAYFVNQFEHELICDLFVLDGFQYVFGHCCAERHVWIFTRKLNSLKQFAESHIMLWWSKRGVNNRQNQFYNISYRLDITVLSVLRLININMNAIIEKASGKVENIDYFLVACLISKLICQLTLII